MCGLDCAFVVLADEPGAELRQRQRSGAGAGQHWRQAVVRVHFQMMWTCADSWCVSVLKFERVRPESSRECLYYMVCY